MKVNENLHSIWYKTDITEEDIKNFEPYFEKEIVSKLMDSIPSPLSLTMEKVLELRKNMDEKGIQAALEQMISDVPEDSRIHNIANKLLENPVFTKMFVIYSLLNIKKEMEMNIINLTKQTIDEVKKEKEEGGLTKPFITQA